MKLICFPYAGGSAMVYSRWMHLADSSIEIVPFELPGRGIRFDEDLCGNMQQLVEDAYHHLKDVFEKEDYMLYGHSMGSWIVYYLTMMIQKKQNRLPNTLFISGREAPHVHKQKDISYLMDNDEFIKKVFVLGGTPKELLENKELLNIFVPILKNDYKLIADCKIEENIHKFDCDITVFNGIHDDVTREEVTEWKKYTQQNFYLYQFDGGHFFINIYTKKILDIICKQMQYKALIA